VKWEKQHGNLSKIPQPILGGNHKAENFSRYGGYSGPILQSYGVTYIFKDAFLVFSLRLIPRKSQGGERWARGAISLGYFQCGISVPRPMVSQYAD